MTDDVQPPDGRLRGVRWRADTQSFEMLCVRCAKQRRGPSFWPLTLEFWNPSFGLMNCRACQYELARSRAKLRRTIQRERVLAEARSYYRANRDVILMKERQRRTAVP